MLLNLVIFKIDTYFIYFSFYFPSNLFLLCFMKLLPCNRMIIFLNGFLAQIVWATLTQTTSPCINWPMGADRCLRHVTPYCYQWSWVSECLCGGQGLQFSLDGSIISKFKPTSQVFQVWESETIPSQQTEITFSFNRQVPATGQAIYQMFSRCHHI